MKSSSRQSGWLAPVPPGVAIEIASRRVTVAELSASAGALVVSAYASEPLPPDVVTPALTGVNIPSPEPVVGALRRALERAGVRSARRAALVVPDAIARVSMLTFEQVPARPADFEALLKWQLRKSTPFPIDEARLDHVLGHVDASGSTFAVVVARRDVIAQYEAVTSAVGVHAGIVDLASFNVMNAVMGAGGAAGGDWLLVCLAEEGTSIAILRGNDLMFYRHRAGVEQEPLSALVHQTAMYYEDRLSGSQFSKVWLCGAGTTVGADEARREIGDRLGLVAEPVDIRPAAALRDRVAAGTDVLDALAAPVGVLLRERTAA
jgi:Tfp pilus assembly PilM family ATPase